MTKTPVAVLTVLGMLALAGPAAADGRWIDARPIANWNRADAAIPKAEKNLLVGEERQRCRGSIKTELDPLEKSVEAAGWTVMTDLAAEPIDIAGFRVIWGMTGADGMCRPEGYQGFVFVGGHFAGTLSPQPMGARADGTGGPPKAASGGRFDVEFARYTGTEPLCCPSRTSTVRYEVRTEAAGPIVVPVSATTRRK
jgi:hypothetical protein